MYYETDNNKKLLCGKLMEQLLHTSRRINGWFLTLLASAIISANFIVTESWPITGILGRLDNAVYTLGGAQWASGKIPYLAFWDNKPPSIYVLNAIAWKISGGFIGIWIFSILACTASIVLFYRVCRNLYDETVALLAVFYYFVIMLPFAEPDIVNNYVLLLTLVSLEIVLNGSSTSNLKISSFFLGFIWGVGFLFRPNAMLVDSVACVLLFVRVERRDGFLRSLSGLLSMVAGVALYVAPIIIYFCTHHAWQALLDCVVRFNKVYISGPFSDHLKAFFAGIGVASGGNVIILAVTFIWVLLNPYAHERPEAKIFERLLPFILIAELILASASGRSYGDYYIMALLISGLLLCSFLASIFRRLTSFDLNLIFLKGIKTACYTGIVGTGLLDFSFASEPVFVKGYWYDHPVQDVAVFLRNNPSDGKVFVWGDHPGIYLLPGVQRNIKFTFMLPFLIKPYSNSWTVSMLLDNLKAVQPTFIFDLSAFEGHGSSLPSLSSLANSTAADPLHPVYVYIYANYARCPGSVPSEFDVYKRRNLGT